MTYKSYKVGQTILVLVCYQTSSVHCVQDHKSLIVSISTATCAMFVYICSQRTVGDNRCVTRSALPVSGSRFQPAAAQPDTPSDTPTLAGSDATCEMITPANISTNLILCLNHCSPGFQQLENFCSSSPASLAAIEPF